MVSGTGVRDAFESGWVTALNLYISECLEDEISAWQQRYERAHFRAFINSIEVDKLDADGLVLRQKLSEVLFQSKVQYFYSAKMKLIAPESSSRRKPALIDLMHFNLM
jgi:hypothetical protein